MRRMAYGTHNHSLYQNCFVAHCLPVVISGSGYCIVVWSYVKPRIFQRPHVALIDGDKSHLAHFAVAAHVANAHHHVAQQLCPQHRRHRCAARRRAEVRCGRRIRHACHVAQHVRRQHAARRHQQRRDAQRPQRARRQQQHGEPAELASVHLAALHRRGAGNDANGLQRAAVERALHALAQLPVEGFVAALVKRRRRRRASDKPVVDDAPEVVGGRRNGVVAREVRRHVAAVRLLRHELLVEGREQDAEALAEGARRHARQVDERRARVAEAERIAAVKEELGRLRRRRQRPVNSGQVGHDAAPHVQVFERRDGRRAPVAARPTHACHAAAAAGEAVHVRLDVRLGEGAVGEVDAPVAALAAAVHGAENEPVARCDVAVRRV